MASYLLAPVEGILQYMIVGHERYIYNPMHSHLKPVVQRIPRRIIVHGHQVDVFTANAVTYFRTSLVIAMSLCLKIGWNVTACLLVVINDILDHVDGIVAKVHREQYGQIDDPMFGAFIDAFCDKVVNVFMLWTILLLVSWSSMGVFQAVIFFSICAGVMGLEAVLGVVRVQDYFMAKYGMKSDDKVSNPVAIRAVAVGKIKEKLENTGLAMLSLALIYDNPMDSWVGVIGIVSLSLSLRFAVGSLMHKLKTRQKSESCSCVKLLAGNKMSLPRVITIDTVGVNNINDNVFMDLDGSDYHEMLPKVQSAPQFQVGRNSTSSDSEEDKDKNECDKRVDKVYTVGCFDLFHRGHVNLLKNMKKLGKEVIVGVHSDESYVKLKNKHTIDSTEKRMSNVKKYANQVFVISSTDPSPYLRCCVHLDEGQTALYVRGDDMPHFPGRGVVEPLMPIKLLPYTQGVSSTMLRAQLLQAGGIKPPGLEGSLNGIHPVLQQPDKKHQ